MKLFLQIDVIFLLEWFSNTHSISIHKEAVRMAYICQVCSELYGETYVTIRRSNSLLFIHYFPSHFVSRWREVKNLKMSVDLFRFFKRSVVFLLRLYSFYPFYLKIFIIIIIIFYLIKRFWSNTLWLNLLFLLKIMLYCRSSNKKT